MIDIWNIPITSFYFFIDVSKLILLEVWVIRMKVFQIQNQFSACLQLLLEAIQLDQDGKILRQHIIDKLVQGKFLLYALDFSNFIIK